MTGIPDPGRASRAVEMLTAGASPFDSIRRVTEQGREFWSARELQPLLGYTEWRKFCDAITRAKASGRNAGHEMSRHIVGAAKVVDLGSGAQRSVEDHHLSRLACYLIAMNGDPRKAEVAEAQTYFAVRTREAETSQPRPVLTEDEIVHQALAITTRRVEALTAKVAELEPKAEFFDELMDADGCYTMQATANMIRWGRNVMMRELRRAGVLQGNNLPYRRYAHHFKVVPGTRTHPKTGELIPTATTHVLPSGVEFIRKRLANNDALAVAE
ncbi:phage antirepressor KilAC domain-containing protein [Mycolicibacterium austroafricanum]|uniref:Phage antirepressor KilAC domain-containing protein n=1 Tax=Mycolicibacterium austroafricanum TaxID=39687 RepID=A0ABT8HKW6_MYCAO|nr:phage antirepressor KilAC domain-containing protein [Mycolicibacterium austroafricanum]MDN4521404.1 phage antirepressor KilAC domain-containing protein [Mycolicibacterium austroafricanum]